MTDLHDIASRLGPLPQRVMIGLSGGADSVALLCLLCEIRERRDMRLVAVHVHHGLRAASDEDERFVAALCAAKRVPLRVYHLSPPPHAGEDWAREERYRCFREADAAEGNAPILLAHHRDDQAETMLLHLLRGVGLTGLGGMRRETEREGLHIIRPLLAFSREELRAYLRAIGQDWREDDSNEGDAYLRNRVRHQLMPLMEELMPGSARRIAESASRLQEDEDALQSLAAANLPPPGERYLCRKTLSSLSPALRKRSLRMLWEREAGRSMSERSLSAAQTEALAALLTAPVGSRCNLPGDWHGYAGWQAIHLLPPTAMEKPAPVPLNPDKASWTLGGAVLTLTDGEGDWGDGRQSQEVPLGWLDGCVLRTQEAGDRIRPFGMQGHKSLQDYFADRRIDLPFRARVPLVCRGHEVYLAGGVGVGDIPRYEPDKNHVRLTWSGQMPWLEMARTTPDKDEE